MSAPKVYTKGRFEWERIIARIVVPPRHRAAKLVAMMAATFADAKTGENVRPGEERLAAMCQLGQSTVRESLKWLRENQLIHRRSRGSNIGKRDLADVYVLCAPEDWETRFLVLPEWGKDTDLVIPKARRSNPQPLGSSRFDVGVDEQGHRQPLAEDVWA